MARLRGAAEVVEDAMWAAACAAAAEYARNTGAVAGNAKAAAGETTAGDSAAGACNRHSKVVQCHVVHLLLFLRSKCRMYHLY